MELNTEIRSTVVAVATVEHHRYRTRHGEDPDVLVLGSDDHREMLAELGHPVPWMADLGGRKLWAAPPEEVDYGQFLGMDIVVAPLMPRGYLIVGRRAQIRHVTIERTRVPP